jgi:hypothetical protein
MCVCVRERERERERDRERQNMLLEDSTDPEKILEDDPDPEKTLEDPLVPPTSSPTGCLVVPQRGSLSVRPTYKHRPGYQPLGPHPYYVQVLGVLFLGRSADRHPFGMEKDWRGWMDV